MPKIKRRHPPKHILIPDTNILWHEKKDVCASPEFSEFWTNYGATYEIELIIPYVVKGELLYQHTSSALTILGRINSQFENLSSFAKKTYKHQVNEKRVRSDINSKFDTWISSLPAEIAQTPVDTINWENLIENSIWRHPPFTEDKDKKNEKGFRDALILETLCSIADARGDIDIAFVTDDRLLAQAAKNRLKNKKQMSFYESLDEFSSYLRLLDEKLTNDFVQAIRKRAKEKFYSEGNLASLVRREAIVDKIREQYHLEFSTPTTTMPLRLALLPLLPKKENWEVCSDEGIWIRAPAFVQLEGESDYIWDSRISFVQLFRYNGQGGGTVLTGTVVPGQENLRKIEFKVIWNATVGKDARFRKMEIRSIELAEKKFEVASEEEKSRYSVEPKAD